MGSCTKWFGLWSWGCHVKHLKFYYEIEFKNLCQLEKTGSISLWQVINIALFFTLLNITVKKYKMVLGMGHLNYGCELQSNHEYNLHGGDLAFVLLVIVLNDDMQLNVKHKLDFDDLKSISQKKTLFNV